MATAVLLGFTVGACGGDGASEAVPIARVQQSGTSLPEGSTLPAPKDKTILTLSGIENPNAGKNLEVDLATLDRMPNVQTTVFEPFLKHDVRFEGVLLSDLLGYAGIGDSSTMTITALDDYRVAFSLEQLDAERVLLATRADGRAIGIPDGGPTRFIFLDASSELGTNTDNWVWSLARMVFATPKT